MELPFPTEIVSFAMWLAVNGLMLVAVLEKFPAFQKLDSRWKSIIVLVVAVGSPFASEWLILAVDKLPDELVSQIQHYLDLALTGLRLWAASQYAHGGLRQYVTAKR